MTVQRLGAKRPHSVMIKSPSADTDDGRWLGLELYVSPAGDDVPDKSTGGVGVRLSGRVRGRGAHRMEDRSGVGVAEAGGEGGAAVVVRPLAAAAPAVHSGVSRRPRSSQVGRRCGRRIARDRRRD